MGAPKAETHYVLSVSVEKAVLKNDGYQSSKDEREVAKIFHVVLKDGDLDLLMDRGIAHLGLVKDA